MSGQQKNSTFADQGGAPVFCAFAKSSEILCQHRFLGLVGPQAAADHQKTAGPGVVAAGHQGQEIVGKIHVHVQGHLAQFPAAGDIRVKCLRVAEFGYVEIEIILLTLLSLRAAI